MKRFCTVIDAISQTQNRAWAFQLIAKQYNQIRWIIANHIGFAADDELGCELGILQIRENQHGKRSVAAEAAVAMFRTAPSVDHDRFRADLDGVVSQDPTPRG